MKSFWVSWYEPPDLLEAFELHWPWWISGSRMSDDAITICAAVKAESEEKAKELILDAHDNPIAALEFRFCEEKPENWEGPFGERFPRADWMDWP